jgi:RNA polymerase sigma factor (sigma-70 family)
MDAQPLAVSGVGNRRARARLSGLKDEGLARLAGNGKEWAFTTLYERYQPLLYRYCRSIVRHEADAQDALQATFASAYGALRAGRRDAPVRPWLFRIAHNESITVLRQRRLQDEIPEDMPSVGADVEARATERERLQQLVADLRALPDRQRSALVMRELSGLSHEEIAVALNSSVAAAKQTIFEARRTLSEYEAGRAMSCDEVCRIVSDRDRRALRSRRVRAHIRHCSECAAFADAVPARTADLRALAAPLPPAVALAILSRATGGAGSAGGGGGAVASGLGTKVALSAAGTKLAAGVAVVSATLGAAAVVGADRPAPRHSVRVAPAEPSVAPGTHTALVDGSTAFPGLALTLPHYAPGRVAVPRLGWPAGHGHTGMPGVNRSDAGARGRRAAHAGSVTGAPRGNAYGVRHTGHGVGNRSAASGRRHSQAAVNHGTGRQVGANPRSHSAVAPGRHGSARGHSGSAPGRVISAPGSSTSALGSPASAARQANTTQPARPASRVIAPRDPAASATPGQARKS